MAKISERIFVYVAARFVWLIHKLEFFDVVSAKVSNTQIDYHVVQSENTIRVKLTYRTVELLRSNFYWIRSSLLEVGRENIAKVLRRQDGEPTSEKL